VAPSTFSHGSFVDVEKMPALIALGIIERGKAYVVNAEGGESEVVTFEKLTTVITKRTTNHFIFVQRK
jgi:hypothetical protein